MIKFFRKNRQKLLIENKFSKYLIYAIGEIILVVIGILIALSINNWNQNKKSIEKGEILFAQVQKELLLNIKKANVVIEHYRRKDSLLYKVLTKKVTYEDYKSGIRFFYIIGNYVSVDATDDAFKNLIEFNGSLTPQQDSIVLKLKSLYGTDKINVDVHDKSMLNDAMILDRYQKDNMEWYYESMTFHKFSDEMIEYHLNDTFFFNEVSAYNN